MTGARPAPPPTPPEPAGLPALPATRAHEVLGWLGVPAAPAGLSPLRAVLAAWTRTVPWESASRIVKRLRAARDAADRPRWPEEFWRDAMTRGTGGTCFESNYALAALLHAVGYDGYLTVNDMGTTPGCHSALVVDLDGDRWLVDVGFPVHAALRIEPGAVGRFPSAFHEYTLRPEGDDRYRVERTMHPEPYCFTLVDRPVPHETYRAVTTADYEPGGHFLDRIVIQKVMAGRQWRFSSNERPRRIESYGCGGRTADATGDDAAGAVAERFGIDERVIREALAAVDANSV